MPRTWAAVLVITMAACFPGHVERAYPRWTLDGGRDLRAGCAIADAFVRKSGKEGIGVALELRSTHDCDVRISDVALVFPDGARARGVVPALTPMVGRSLVYVWIPIRFDGDRAWNEQRLRASLEVALTAGADAKQWRIPAEERFPARWRDTWAAAP